MCEINGCNCEMAAECVAGPGSWYLNMKCNQWGDVWSINMKHGPWERCVNGTRTCCWKEARRIQVKGQGFSRTKNSAGPKMHSLELSCSIYAWMPRLWNACLWYISMAKCEVRIWHGCDGVDVNGAVGVNVCALQLWACGKIMINGRQIQQDQDAWNKAPLHIMIHHCGLTTHPGMISQTGISQSWTHA
jgi:hypothetical protein